MEAATVTVTLTTLQATIARALRNSPADRLRIERAAQLIALGRVQRTGRREWTVESQNNPAVWYLVDWDSCNCEDQKRRPLQICKHRYAAFILYSAERRQEISDAATRRARFPGLSAQELHRLSEFKAKYQERVA